MIEHSLAGKNITWRQRIKTSSYFNHLSVSDRLRRRRVAGPTASMARLAGRTGVGSGNQNPRRLSWAPLALRFSPGLREKGANRYGKARTDPRTEVHAGDGRIPSPYDIAYLVLDFPARARRRLRGFGGAHRFALDAFGLVSARGGGAGSGRAQNDQSCNNCAHSSGVIVSIVMARLDRGGECRPHA